MFIKGKYAEVSFRGHRVMSGAGNSNTREYMMEVGDYFPIIL